MWIITVFEQNTYRMFEYIKKIQSYSNAFLYEINKKNQLILTKGKSS